MLLVVLVFGSSGTVLLFHFSIVLTVNRLWALPDTEGAHVIIPWLQALLQMSKPMPVNDPYSHCLKHLDEVM